VSDFEVPSDKKSRTTILENPDFEMEPAVVLPPVESDFETQAQQVIDRAPDPERTRQMLQQATALHEAVGLPWDEAFHKASVRGDAKWQKGLKEVEAGWQSGWIDLNLGYIMYERMAATLSLGSKDPAKRAAAEARVRELDELAAKIEKERPELDPKKQGLLWRALTSTSRMLPIMLKGLEKGGRMGLATGAGAAGMAALLGQAGPQVGMPEEVVTVPGAAALGFGIGTAVGGAQHIMKVEAGLAMVEMLKEDIDPQVAAAASLGVGVINSLLEVVQVGDLLKSFPGASDVLRRVVRGTTRELVKKGVLRTLARTALSMGKHIAVETLQELAQESVNIAAEELGKQMTNALRTPNIIGGVGVERQSLEPAEISQIVDRLKETAIDSALGFGVLQLPGAVARTVATGGKVMKAEAEPSAPVVVSPTDQAVSEARALMRQPGELTTKRVAQTAAKLDAVIQSEASTPEEVVRAVQTADALEREAELAPVEVAPGVKAETPEAEAEALRVIASGLEETEAKEIQEEVHLARQAGVENAEDFIREQKATELPGQEKPAEVYRKAFEETPPTPAEEEAQRFLEGLSKEDVETQVMDAVSNPAVPPEALKMLAPIYQRISAEGSLTDEHFGELVRKMATQPKRWQEAFQRALPEEQADYERARLYEAGLKARLPKQPGEGLKKYRPLNVADVLRQKDNKDLEPVRKRISQIVHAALKPPSGAVNYEEAIQIEQIQEMIDARPGKRIVKTQERMRRYYEAHPDEPITEGTRKFLDKQFIGAMSYGELEALDKKIRDLRQVGRTKRTLALLEEKKKIAKAQEGIKQDLLGIQPFEPTRAKGSVTAEKQMKGGAGRFVQAYSLNMLRLARKLGPTAEKWLTDEVNKTLDTELRAVDKIAEPAKAKLKKLGIHPRDLSKELQTKDGMRFTVDQVIHMYLAIKNEDERATLIHGNNVSAVEVAELVGQLSKEQKAWGDYMLSVFAGDNFERLNKAYIEDSNQSPAKVENYFPIRAREGTYEAISQEIQSDLTTRAGARRGYPGKGFLIERMNIADEHRRPMRLGATAIFFEQIEKQEHYISHWKLAKRLQNIFTRDKALVETISLKFGREWQKAISTYINEVANPGAFKANDLRVPLIDALRNNFVLGALAFNINSVLNNLTGPLLYMADAGPLHMMSAAAQWARHPKQLYDFVTSRDPQVKHVSMDPILESIRSRYGAGPLAEFQRVVAKIGMKPMQWVDMWTRLIGWKAVYDKSIVADKMSEQEAIQAAQKSTLRTQPSGRLKDVPLMYHDRGAQMFLMFTRQLNQIWNMTTADIPMDIRQGKVLHALADATALALTGIAIGTIGRKRLPDDAGEWVLDLVGQFISGIPLVGDDILTGLQGYWWSGRGVNLLGIASSLFKEGRKRASRGGDLQDWADSFLNITPELMKALGLPGVAAGRIIHLIETGDPWELVGGKKE